VAIGGSGGSRIFGAVVQVLLNLDLGLDISQAVEYGRLHDQLYPLDVDADDTYPPELIDALRERGHNVTGDLQTPLDHILLLISISP
jgi:gamma-glutamyltranspeptidase/glutathione hydrolase/leukotriene-C4 hydrolase